MFSKFELKLAYGLAIWLLLMGAIWMAMAVRPRVPRWQNLLWGGLLFALIWIALGLISQYTWFQWYLIPSRLWRWPIFALACLPWKLALGHALQRAKGWGKAGLWLIQSVVAVAALLSKSLSTTVAAIVTVLVSVPEKVGSTMAVMVIVPPAPGVRSSTSHANWLPGRAVIAVPVETTVGLISPVGSVSVMTT